MTRNKNCFNRPRDQGPGGGAEWNVYILRCGDGTFYTGIAKDVQKRLREHKNGKGAAYTRSHLPVDLLHQKSGFTRSQALIWESAIKRLPRGAKEALIAEFLTQS